MKGIRYFFEAVFLHLFYAIFRLLPLDSASALGGWIGRTIGPHLPDSRIALANLKEALPGRTDEEYARIVAGMWENLGRVMAEYPHLAQIGRERVEISTADKNRVLRLRDDGKPGVLFGAHLANWEACAAALQMKYGFSMDLVYRAPNNPWVVGLLERARNLNGILKTIRKSRAGARQIVDSLKQGRHVAILIDQKYNEGISVPFFGRPAMTSEAFVQLAQKHKCPLVPGRMERLGGANFRLSTDDGEISLFDATGRPLPAEHVIAEAHARLECWIAAQPEQWLWIHRRWIHS